MPAQQHAESAVLCLSVCGCCCLPCAADVANLISKTLEVDSSILTAVLFTQYGMTVAWRLQGSTANELSYTVRLPTGGKPRCCPSDSPTVLHGCLEAGASPASPFVNACVVRMVLMKTRLACLSHKPDTHMHCTALCTQHHPHALPSHVHSSTPHALCLSALTGHQQAGGSHHA